MGLRDRLKNLTKKAEDTAAEHTNQIHQAVQKVEAAADQRTGGKYHDKIEKAGAKADAMADRLEHSHAEAPAQGASTRPEQAPPAS
jgi:hypothetical protein